MKLITGLFVQGLAELVDCRGNLQSLLEHCLLALDANVFGPFDETAKIPLGLDILTC
jgi:hypothetical protein